MKKYTIPFLILFTVTLTGCDQIPIPEELSSISEITEISDKIINAKDELEAKVNETTETLSEAGGQTIEGELVINGNKVIIRQSDGYIQPVTSEAVQFNLYDRAKVSAFGEYVGTDFIVHKIERLE